MAYQLLEEQLKSFLGSYYEAVRLLLRDRLHFGFEVSEVREAPLGKLIHLFSKACNDKQLVNELRAVLSHRQQIAHRAFLLEYESDPSDDEFYKLALEAGEQALAVAALVSRVLAHRGNVVKGVAPPPGDGI